MTHRLPPAPPSPVLLLSCLPALSSFRPLPLPSLVPPDSPNPLSPPRCLLGAQPGAAPPAPSLPSPAAAAPAPWKRRRRRNGAMYFQLLLMTFTSWKPRGEASAMQAAGSAQTTSVPTADHRRARGHEPKTKQPRGGGELGAGGTAERSALQTPSAPRRHRGAEERVSLGGHTIIMGVGMPRKYKSPHNEQCFFFFFFSSSFLRGFYVFPHPSCSCRNLCAGDGSTCPAQAGGAFAK